jgi:hypothetical protein
VLKNLLSNAFKFTEQGGVRLNVALASAGWTSDHPVLSQAAAVVAFEVSDTGIGIPPRSRRSSSRRSSRPTPAPAASTAAPASASRSAASWRPARRRDPAAQHAGRGSTFTLYLPLSYVGPRGASRREPSAHGRARRRRRRADAPTARRSRCPTTAELAPGDAILLIVEDDPHYARVLVDLGARHGLQGARRDARAEALALARQFHPTAVFRSTCSCPTCSAGRSSPS